MSNHPEERALYVISVAAELAQMHPQTLRQYDRLGLVQPTRAPGRARRYSPRDIEKLREVQRLSQEGISLEGIRRILQLENQVIALQRRMMELQAERDAALEQVRHDQSVWAASPSGEVIRLPRGSRPPGTPPGPTSSALMVYRPRRSS
ncbi:heat shock protein transcriptional repressor HspR [Kocuria sp.]|uniref:heat shock protein transcriptional repressor HspR n=1 Tax=Kocuria sp. TaxID=1871328 RepID=UPI0026DEFEC6|nr:MerR family transcriptional regulator [Kocuria sp.]MDO5618602.1 MerR family transcriptional regulator [Kocuria sp.]